MWRRPDHHPVDAPTRSALPPCSSATKWPSCMDGGRFVGLVTRHRPDQPSPHRANHEPWNANTLGLRHPRHSRRPASRSADRRGHAADLRDLDLRAASPGVHKGYEYARTHNPTRMAYERCVADLESGTRGFAFASGLGGRARRCSSCSTPARTSSPRDDLYGGTYRLFSAYASARRGSQSASSICAIPPRSRRRIRPETRMIWVETPTNPLLKLVDLAAVAEMARDAASSPSADNTFASPFVQRPLEQGFDIVVHSTTKYLNGHSDMVGGVAVVRRERGARRAAGLPAERARRHRQGPFDRFLALRGVKTLALRMERHCANALAVAAVSPATRAWPRPLPGPAEPPRARAGAPPDARVRRHRDGRLKGDLDDARRIAQRCHLFALAESLGGVESLIEHPALMTHASTPRSSARRSASTMTWCASRSASRGYRRPHRRSAAALV